MTPVIRTFSWAPEFARGFVGSASALGLPRQSQLILREPRRGDHPRAEPDRACIRVSKLRRGTRQRAPAPYLSF